MPSTASRPWAVWVIAAALLVALALLDWAAGWQLRFTIFYLFVVWFVATRLGLTHGLVAAAACALAGQLADVLAGEPIGHAGVAWNLAARTAALGTVAVLLAQQRRLLTEQRNLALTDPLTGALNRRALHEELARAIARGRRLGLSTAVVCLDLDGFKALNDRSGHAAGDAVLRKVAEAARAALRAGDAVGRLGGDEFVLVLGEMEHGAADFGARRAFEAVRAALQEGFGGHRVGVSGGACVIGPSEAAGVDEALAAADRLLYAAKSAPGKGRLRVGVLKDNAADQAPAEAAC